MRFKKYHLRKQLKMLDHPRRPNYVNHLKIIRCVLLFKQFTFFRNQNLILKQIFSILNYMYHITSSTHSRKQDSSI